MYLIIAEKRSAAEKVGSCIKGESFKKAEGGGGTEDACLLAGT